MNTRMRIILAVVFLGFVALITLPVYGQGDKTAAAQTKPEEKRDDYQTLVKRVKDGDLKVDFGALRMAYTKTEGFSGYGDSGKRAMFAAVRTEKYAEALTLAEKRLDQVFVDLNAHYVAALAQDGLKNQARADFHRQVFVGLIDSIIKGHDGQTPGAAYDVISVDEEYAVISYLGFVPSAQGLVREEGHTFDLMTVTDSKTKATHKLYFNIDRFFGKF